MKKAISALVAIGLLGLGTFAQATTKAQAEMEYGDAWAELGNWKRAVSHYQQAVKLDAKLTSARLSLANGFYRLGQKQKAMQELQSLQKRQPKSVAVACALGVIQLDVKKPALACKSFSRALALDTNHGRSLFGVGQCHHGVFEQTTKEHEKKLAMGGYSKYLKLFPRGPHAVPAKEAIDQLKFGEVGKTFNQAKEAFSSGKYRLAERMLREVVQKRCDLQEAQYLLGLTLASPVINKIDQAEQAWKKAGELKEALLQRGILAYEEEELEEAQDLLNQAIKIDKRYAAAFYYLGLIYHNLLKNKEAQEAFRQVTRLAPKTALGERASSKLQVMSGQLMYLREGETIDTASEIELGRKLTGQIEKQFGLLDDQELQLRLNKILRNIAAHSDRLPGSMPYRVKVLNVDGINALSFIGGTIYIFKGLVDFVRRELDDSDDAYAAILGHEVVHVVMRHGLGMLDLIGGTRSLMKGSSFDVRSLNKLMVGMSRIHEFEADHLGCLYAYRAGYDPAAAYRFHRALISSGKEVPEGLDHPTHDERAGRLKEYLMSLRTKARHFDAGLKALDNNDFETSMLHFEIFLGLFPSSWSAKNNLGVAMHRLALATKQKKREYKLSTDIDPGANIRSIRLRGAETSKIPVDRALMIEAAEVFGSISRSNPEYAMAKQNLGSCLLALGEMEQARRIFALVLKKLPDSAQATSNLAVVHLLSNQTEKGIELLDQVIKTHPGFADAYYNKALALQKSGKTDAARKAWLAYLAKDQKSGWAKSARKHLADIK